MDSRIAETIMGRALEQKKTRQCPYRESCEQKPLCSKSGALAHRLMTLIDYVFVAGATRLELATSGVTGQSKPHNTKRFDQIPQQFQFKPIRLKMFRSISVRRILNNF
jgi:hypothetical protein